MSTVDQSPEQANRRQGSGRLRSSRSSSPSKTAAKSEPVDDEAAADVVGETDNTWLVDDGVRPRAGENLAAKRRALRGRVGRSPPFSFRGLTQFGRQQIRQLNLSRVREASVR